MYFVKRATILLFWLFVSLDSAAQFISNVDFFTQGETIIIAYDLSECPTGEKQDIQLHFEYRNGQRITPITLQGDYQQVSCGSGKRIVWQVKEDLEEFQCECRAVLSIVPKFKPVQIGAQVWMSANLNVSTFRNGDPIPEAKSAEEWQRAGQNWQPAWCYYDNNPANGVTYGKLYNWYAVRDLRGICPVGWHVPSDAEWTDLTNYLGTDAGNKLKSTSGWGENGNGNNSSGFSGLPGGYRFTNGNFDYNGANGGWWSTTENYITSAWIRNMNQHSQLVGRLGFNKGIGLSVRCDSITDLKELQYAHIQLESEDSSGKSTNTRESSPKYTYNPSGQNPSSTSTSQGRDPTSSGYSQTPSGGNNNNPVGSTVGGSSSPFGHGLGGRGLISYPGLPRKQRPEQGIAAFEVCINSAGVVTEIRGNTRNNQITDPAMLEEARAAIRKLKFSESNRGLQCGEVTITFNY